MFNDFVTPNLFPVTAEIFLLVMTLLILMVDLGVKDPKRGTTFMLSQVALLVSSLIILLTGDGQVAYTFSNMFVDDLMADMLKFFTLLAVSVALFYARPYVNARPDMAVGEFYVLTLFATLGMMVMISANHFLTIYLGLEILSLSLYALVALNRNSVVSTEAAMKYFVLGALASGLLLYGMSMLYGVTGTLEITQLAEGLYAAQGNKTVLVFGLVFLVAGLAFKLGVVPFHMWIPDVYHGAPTAVTMLIGSAPKLAAFAIVMRLLVGGLLSLSADWQGMLLILAVLSIALGNVAAIAQTNIKRMLAYSAIAHMGFMLLGLVTGVVGGETQYALNAYSSAMFYVMVYVLTSLASFGVIILLSRAGFEADTLDDFKGLNKRSPWFAAVMMMVMFSMAGVPFFVGFFAKFSVLQAVVLAGYYWLAIIAVLFSLVGAFYYLRVVKIMYFDEPIDMTPIQSTRDVRVLLSVNGLALGVIGLFPQLLMTLCIYALMRSL